MVIFIVAFIPVFLRVRFVSSEKSWLDWAAAFMNVIGLRATRRRTKFTEWGRLSIPPVSVIKLVLLPSPRVKVVRLPTLSRCFLSE